MTFAIKADEIEQNFFSNIKPSFGLLRKTNFQIPPLCEIDFWDNIKNSDYAKKYIEECFDYLLLNCSIIKAANPTSTSQDSSITHETASAMKSVLLSLIHITTFYKNKSSNIKPKNNEKTQQDNSFIPQINPLENKASIIIRNSSFPQVRKVIEFTINQLFNKPVNIVKDLPSMSNYLLSLNDHPCLELKSTRIFNNLLLFHRLKFDKITRKLFYPSLLEVMKSKLKISTNSTKLSETIRDLSQFLYLYFLVMTLHPELSNDLPSILPFLNSRIINMNPFSELCYELHSTTKKEIDHPGYSFYKMLEYASTLSPITNNTITIFYDFQNKLFPSMMYSRENDKMSFKLAYINYAIYYLTRNLGVDSEQAKKLSISDLLKVFSMIKFTKKDDAKIISTFKLASSKSENLKEKSKTVENEEEDADDNDGVKIDVHINQEINDDDDDDDNQNDINVPLPPYIPFSLVRIQPNLYLNPENLIMIQTSEANEISGRRTSFNIDDEQEKMKEKKKKKETKKEKKGKEQNFEESYNDKTNIADETQYYMYNCVLHKVYTENVFKPIFEYMKQNEDQKDEIINHQILVCGNDSAMGKLLMFHLISSLQTDPAAKAAGLIKNLNIEVLDNINLTYYIFPFNNSSWSTQIANFLSAIDPIYEKFVNNIYDLTSHIAPTFSDASKVSFIPIEENEGDEIQKKLAPPPPPPPPPSPSSSKENQQAQNENENETEEKSEKSDKEEEKSHSDKSSGHEEEKVKESESEKDKDSENDQEPESNSNSNSNNNNNDNETNTNDKEENENINNDNQSQEDPPTNDNIKGFNKFDSDCLFTCNPTPSSMLQLAIQHFLLFARDHVEILVWSCVIYMNNSKKVVIPFVSGVRFGFSSGSSSSSSQTSSGASAASGGSSGNNGGNNGTQNEEIKPKKLIIETINSNNQITDSQRLKLVSFSIWNSNMDLNCDPRSPLLLKEVCYTVNAHNQLIQREIIRANGSFSYASNRLSLVDSQQDKKSKKKLQVNTNVIPSNAQPFVLGTSSSEQNLSLASNDQNAQNLQNNTNSVGELNDGIAESNSCIIDLNDENESTKRVTKKMRDNWAKINYPKIEQSGMEQNLKVYTNEFIKGITVSIDKDQPPFSILVDGVEYENVKKFAIEPMIDPANGVEQMKIRLACFSSE